MRIMKGRLLGKAWCSVAVLSAGWATGVYGADKSAYDLFNPVPREEMRELSADRPDVTESPYTVDAGHFQIEMDTFRYGYDSHLVEDGVDRVESYSIAPMNLKAGLLNNVDLQLVLEPYTHVRTKSDAGDVDHSRGFGDITVRSKINIWGNDGGRTAFAIMPAVKIPTNQDGLGNDAVEGGLIFPLGIGLSENYSMGVMAEFDWVEDGDERGYHAEFLNTIVFGGTITGALGGYLEFISLTSAESDSDWIAVLGTGVTYAINDDVQVDAGMNFGLTRAAEDISSFVGLTWRF